MANYGVNINLDGTFLALPGQKTSAGLILRQLVPIRLALFLLVRLVRLIIQRRQIWAQGKLPVGQEFVPQLLILVLVEGE